MPQESGYRDEQVRLRLTWDREAGAGYLSFTDAAAGTAVSQRVVASPVPRAGDVVLDFDGEGRVLGVEFLGRGVLPPGLATLLGER
ncbi:DUF2283 domain-containing protein [Modestobacter altitudinis]|uniref:DUF2283 domain-containing protein n=1 Tax=Modestobacter altitudinis TaxID=2213158 RepID=UPI0014873AAC|nr:DUF2283 domain-containing protein [Modestobacter altitudinis]